LLCHRDIVAMLLRLVRVESIPGLQVIRQQFVGYFRRARAVQDADPIRFHVEKFHLMDFNHGAACILHPEIGEIDLRCETRRQQQEERQVEAHNGDGIWFYYAMAFLASAMI
jgi:hypothetical protein